MYRNFVFLSNTTKSTDSRDDAELVGFEKFGFDWRIWAFTSVGIMLLCTLLAVEEVEAQFFRRPEFNQKESGRFIRRLIRSHRQQILRLKYSTIRISRG